MWIKDRSVFSPSGASVFHHFKHQPHSHDKNCNNYRDLCSTITSLDPVTNDLSSLQQLWLRLRVLSVTAPVKMMKNPSKNSTKCQEHTENSLVIVENNERKKEITTFFTFWSKWTCTSSSQTILQHIYYIKLNLLQFYDMLNGILRNKHLSFKILSLYKKVFIRSLFKQAWV